MERVLEELQTERFWIGFALVFWMVITVLGIGVHVFSELIDRRR